MSRRFHFHYCLLLSIESIDHVNHHFEGQLGEWKSPSEKDLIFSSKIQFPLKGTSFWPLEIAFGASLFSFAWVSWATECA